MSCQAPQTRQTTQAGFQTRQSTQGPSFSRRSASVVASARSAARSASVQNFNSQIEQQVINAQQPIQVNTREQVQAGPFKGLYLNKSEVDQFRGPVPIDQYRINEDANPEVIKKRLDKLKYVQEVAVKYLNPPPAPKPGDLVIVEKQGKIPPAPPVVIRQEGQGAQTPAPLVYREKPPKRPACIPPQTIEVEGTPVPPPARRVVYEKLSNLPAKPQAVLIEKWLPYKQQKRRVVYQKSCAAAPQNPRNLIIEWEAPEVEVEQVCRDLGVVDADPEEYIRQYGPELKDACEIPNLCQGNCPAPQRSPSPQCPAPRQPSPQCPAPRSPSPQCPAPREPTPQCQAPRQPTPAPRTPTPAPAPAQSCGCAGGSRAASTVPELEGDVAALRRVDLEKHGLGAYRRYVQ